MPADLSSTTTATGDPKSAILASALAILTSGTALTVRNVAAGANCSTTGVYTWFGGKNGLIEALFIEGFESFDTAIYAHQDFLAACHAYRTWAIDHPTHYKIMFGSIVSDFEPSDAAMARALSSYAGVVDMTRQIVPANTSDAEVERRAYHVWATIHGYTMLELVGMRPPTDADQVKQYDMALHALHDEVRLPSGS
jgi:AcrR family transcriptional regulator